MQNNNSYDTTLDVNLVLIKHFLMLLTQRKLQCHNYCELDFIVCGTAMLYPISLVHFFCVICIVHFKCTVSPPHYTALSAML